MVALEFKMGSCFTVDSVEISIESGRLQAVLGCTSESIYVKRYAGRESAIDHDLIFMDRDRTKHTDSIAS